MKKFFSLLLVMIMMAALVVTGCGGQTGKEPADGKPEYKAGFIYVGPIGDGGFTYAPVSYTHLDVYKRQGNVEIMYCRGIHSIKILDIRKV